MNPTVNGGLGRWAAPRQSLSAARTRFSHNEEEYRDLSGVDENIINEIHDIIHEEFKSSEPSGFDGVVDEIIAATRRDALKTDPFTPSRPTAPLNSRRAASSKPKTPGPPARSTNTTAFAALMTLLFSTAGTASFFLAQNLLTPRVGAPSAGMPAPPPTMRLNPSEFPDSGNSPGSMVQAAPPSPSACVGKVVGNSRVVENIITTPFYLPPRLVASQGPKIVADILDAHNGHTYRYKGASTQLAPRLRQCSFSTGRVRLLTHAEGSYLSQFPDFKTDNGIWYHKQTNRPVYTIDGILR